LKEKVARGENGSNRKGGNHTNPRDDRGKNGGGWADLRGMLFSTIIKKIKKRKAGRKTVKRAWGTVGKKGLGGDCEEVMMCRKNELRLID